MRYVSDEWDRLCDLGAYDFLQNFFSFNEASDLVESVSAAIQNLSLAQHPIDLTGADTHRGDHNEGAVARVRANMPSFSRLGGISTEFMRNLIYALESGIVELDCEEESLITYVVKDVVLEEPDSGLEVALGDIRLKVDVMGSITAYGSVLDSSGTFIHPHISAGGAVCLGEGAVLYSNFWLSGDVVNALEIIAITLRTYNPDSVFRDLVSWMEDSVACCACGTFMANLDDSYGCSCAELESTTPGDTSPSLCGDCVVTCDNCNCEFSPGNVGGCYSCSMVLCCMCANYSELGEYFCPSCSDICPNCFSAVFHERPSDSDDTLIKTVCHLCNEFMGCEKCLFEKADVPRGIGIDENQRRYHLRCLEEIKS